MTTFLAWIGQAIVVGVGWYVVHKLTTNREREKALRDAVLDSVDTIAGSVTDLLACAQQYHRKERDIADEIRIKMDLQDLSIRLNSLSDIYLEASPLAHCRSKVTGLRKAITGQHFEDEHYAPLTATDQQYQSIAAAALDLKHGLLKIRNSQFQIKIT